MATITGDKEIDRKLRHLAGSGQRRVARSGIGKAMTVLSRGIRNAIPPNYRTAKKAIGRRNKKNKVKNKYEAKVGMGVGKQTKSKKQRDPRKPGVGITKANIHWLILGTTTRRREDGSSAGRMPPIGKNWVQQGVKASEGEAVRAMHEQMRKKLAEEARKG